MRTSVVALFVANILFVLSHPQTGYGGAPAAPAPYAPASQSQTQSSPVGLVPAPETNAAPAPAPLNFPITDSSAVSIPAAPAPATPAGGTSAGNCQQTNVGGRYKVVCSGPEKEALRSEHVLWLKSEGETPSIVDIEIPNYKIEELIKAGFKPGPQRDAIINVLLKRPTTSVDAQVDKQTPSSSVPKVNLQYETGTQKLVHFPKDAPYSPLVGPLLPPYDGDSSSSATASASAAGASASSTRRLLKKRKRTPTTQSPADE